MKNMMEKGKYIDWKSLLLSKYKSLDIKEEEVLIILMIDFCLQNGETVITPDVLALKMNYDQNTIDNHLSILFNKGYITLDSNEEGKLQTSLNGLKYILISSLINNEEKPEKEEKDLEKEKNIFNLFETKFGRPLSFIEMETMNKWFEEGIEDDKILLALNEAIKAKKKNIRYIDKILLEWRQQQERKEEGYTTITDNWHKDIKETNKIANLSWARKNENK